MDWRRPLHDGAADDRGFRLQLPGEPGDGATRPARTRSQRVPRRAAHLGEPAHADPGEGLRRLLAQAQDLRILPRQGDRGRAAARGGQSRARGPARDPHTGRIPRLRTGARPDRLAPRALVPDRRRAARRRHLPFFPRLRRQPEAGLRFHRNERVCLRAVRQRGRSQYGRPAWPGHRGAHRGERRSAGARRQRLSRLSQAGGGHARGDRRAGAGSTPEMPASSTRRDIWRSSTAPRTSASSAPGRMRARRSRRSSSRTS